MIKEELETAIGALEASGRLIDNWTLIFAILVAIFLLAESVFGVLHWRNENQLRPLRVEEARLHELELAQLAKDTEQAKDRAAQAELELEKLKTPRILTPEQQQRIIAIIKEYAGQKYMLAVSQDPDSITLLGAFRNILVNAGWTQVPQTMAGSTIQGAAIAIETGISIQTSFLAQNEKTKARAKTLAKALVAEGLTAEHQFSTVMDEPDIIIVTVGQKPLR